MRHNQEQFLVNKVNVNRREFLSSYIDQNLLVASMPGLRTVSDVSDMPWEKIHTAFEDFTEYKHPFKRLMRDYGTKVMIDDEYFSFKQRFDGFDYMTVLHDVNEDDACPGLGGEEFAIVLNDRRLMPTDYIAPVNAPYKQLRIVKRAEPYGGGALYRVRYSVPSGEFFDKKFLKEGTKWEKKFSAVGEAASRRGSFLTSYNKGWLEYGNNMTTLSKEAKVTDKADAQYLVFTNLYDRKQFGMDDKGEKIIDIVEVEFIAQTNVEEQNYLMWGTGNSAPLTQSDVPDESSGYHVNIGTGFFGYAIYSTTFTYFKNKLSSKYVFDKAQSVVAGRLRFSDYNWAITGGFKFTEGIINSNKREFGQAGFTINANDRTKSAPAIAPGREGVEFDTKQFVRINFDPYGSLLATHWPDLDSPHFFAPDVKLDGHPISSWWGFIFNLGLRGSSKKNIEYYEKRNSEMYRYVIGMIGPLGRSGNGVGINARNSSANLASHSGAYYEIHWQKTVGFNMRNPEDLMWFMPNVM